MRNSVRVLVCVLTLQCGLPFLVGNVLACRLASPPPPRQVMRESRLRIDAPGTEWTIAEREAIGDQHLKFLAKRKADCQADGERRRPRRRKRRRARNGCRRTT